MADETKSPELAAIETVAKHVDEFKKDLGNKADKSQFDGIQKDLSELKSNITKWDGDKVSESMTKINEAIQKLEKQSGEMLEDIQRGKDSGKGRQKSMLVDPLEVKKFCEDTFKDGIKTHNAAAMKINGKMVLKTAEIMGYPDFFAGDPSVDTDISAFTGRMVDPTLYQRKRKKNFILDNMPIESTDSPILVYLEKIEIAGDDGSQEDVGGAEWIVPGAQKPMRSFRVTSTKVESKKVAIFGTVHDELLKDVPSMENWVREDFTDEMRESYNDALLNNDPGSDPDAPLGLKTNAIQYADTAAFNNTIPDANELDAIVAAIAYMASLKEEPQLVAVSSSIFYKLIVLKDSEGRYHNSGLVYVNTLGQLFIAGVRVVPADTEDVPDTHILLIGVGGFKIKNHGPLVFERGLNGEDFRYDRTSFRAYQRVLSYIPSHRENSVLYDAIATIITAIDKP